MAAQTLAEALEAEHRSIDLGIESFLDGDRSRPGPLLDALRALRRHIFLEEEFLFRPLRTAGLVAPIFVMLREHGEIWDTMDALEAQLAIEPATEAVAAGCRALLEQLGSHNFKEEPIIYPEVDGAMHGPAGAPLRAWLAHGQVPEAWRCARAGVLPVGQPAPDA
ncbi:MAG: hemerythrin domain-containing protein [Solirubrobacteraceae bacterium]